MFDYRFMVVAQASHGDGVVIVEIFMVDGFSAPADIRVY